MKAFREMVTTISNGKISVFNLFAIARRNAIEMFIF